MYTLAIALSIPLVLGFASGYKMDISWYNGLNKSPYSPPGWVFGVAWTILYAAIGYASYLVPTTLLPLYFAGLALNLMWSPLFFTAHDAATSYDLIKVMIVLAAITAVVFYRANPTAGKLMILYLCWLVFAATLNAYVVNYNTRTLAKPYRPPQSLRQAIA